MGAGGDNTFGALLRRYRRAAGLSQEALAERALMSTRGVSDLERGVHKAPYRETVARLIDALDLDDEHRTMLQAAAERPSRPAAAGPADVSRHNLAEEATSFVGRATEIAEIRALLSRPGDRLITLVGPGGSGKTRLALRVAAAVLGDYPGGVFVVSLGPLADPALVPSAIATALGLGDQDDGDVLADLKQCLRDRTTLLVLDNFEHLLGAAELLPTLLEECPGLHLIVTSQTVLRLSWERVFLVAPLAVPKPPHPADPEALAQYEGIALFVDRATAASSSFALTDENAAAVAEICYRLDGLPLAIELAAARIRLFTPQALLDRLASRLALLTTGSRDRPSRHQTLRASIEWSISLLDDGEQALFRRLAVFAGGCTLSAAEAVSGCVGDASDPVEALASLVDRSLLQQEAGHGEPRFQMLETIREYAAEQLAASGTVDDVGGCHARYFAELAERAAGELAGSGANGSFARLEDEQDNLRAALHWACEQHESDLGLRLAIALSPFWRSRGRLTEGRHWFAEVLAIEAGSTPVLRAHALRIAGERAFAGDLGQAAELTEQSLALYRAAEDTAGLAQALHQSGVIAFHQADYARALECLEQSTELARELGDTDLVARSLWSLAQPDPAARNRADARRSAEETLALHRRRRDPRGVAAALEVLLYAARADGDLHQMRALFTDVVRLLQEPGLEPDFSLRERVQRIAFEMATLGDYPLGTHLLDVGITVNERAGNRRDAAHLRTALAQFSREQGRYELAAELYTDCLEVFAQVDDEQGQSLALVGLGDVARDQGDAETNRRHTRAGFELARELGDTVLMGYAWHNLGCADWSEGDHAHAEEKFESALDALAQIVEGRAEVLASIGLMALDQGDTPKARSAASASLETLRLGDLAWLVATDLETIAGADAADGEALRAARLFGAASTLRAAVGTPVQRAYRPLVDRFVDMARGALGGTVYEEEYQAGAALPPPDVVSTALAGTGSSTCYDQGPRLWRGYHA
jgi:predicted ATPase